MSSVISLQVLQLDCQCSLAPPAIAPINELSCLEQEKFLHNRVINTVIVKVNFLLQQQGQQSSSEYT